MRDLTNIESYADSGLNDACKEIMKEYLTRGIHPGQGSFVEALLYNNLKETFKRADDVHLGRLIHIVAWIYECVPTEFYGSEFAVYRHCARHALARTLDTLGIRTTTCQSCGWKLKVHADSVPEMGKERAYDNKETVGTFVCVVCGAEYIAAMRSEFPADEEFVRGYAALMRDLADVIREEDG